MTMTFLFFTIPSFSEQALVHIPTLSYRMIGHSFFTLKTFFSLSSIIVNHVTMHSRITLCEYVVDVPMNYLTFDFLLYCTECHGRGI